MNTALMFSRQTDDWSTPQAFFDALDAEFQFTIDAAASAASTKCRIWYGDRIDALAVESWSAVPCSIFLNPPYSKCREFIAKASLEARKGCTVVCLVPARCDTQWFHECVWDATTNAYRPGVEVRFVKGRLKFGEGKSSAPFPSIVIVFRRPA